MTFLGGKQFMEPLAYRTIHGPLGTAAEFFSRGRLRRVIHHEFGEMYRTARPSLDCEGDLAEVLGVGNLVRVLARGLQ
jgi:hypothetical protein